MKLFVNPIERLMSRANQASLVRGATSQQIAPVQPIAARHRARTNTERIGSKHTINRRKPLNKPYYHALVHEFYKGSFTDCDRAWKVFADDQYHKQQGLLSPATKPLTDLKA